ncbi:hypothetical protein DO97_13675 [Neosynechococcus sphagnicola sy1]|uniref:DUF1350 domain-containing protein n=2 Tax=Neosynechococcus TaxID=1501143 RepID=A0A098TIN2_9CYAN|nr:DUF1350 family protein [Neosynechococcus sphagnicola]KGF71959.1 hypothetical protein DO97_13675 [Neosynechococcus sphagnicola sy1]
MEWQEISNNWVWVPPRPIGVVHFLGGAFVAAAPQVTYCRLLESLGRQGYVIVATPFVNTFDHQAIADDVLNRFESTLERLQATVLRRKFFPIYGVGHSMGCKLHLLLGSLFAIERAGNILISFNNYSARNSIPLAETLVTALDMEFTPSPAATNRLVAQRYQVRRNLLIQFTKDELDQTKGLQTLLNDRFPGMVVTQTLPGNHLTPLGPDVNWQAGSAFSPLDAIAQWMRKEVYRELHELEKAMLLWLNPCVPR